MTLKRITFVALLLKNLKVYSVIIITSQTNEGNKTRVFSLDTETGHGFSRQDTCRGTQRQIVQVS